ELLEAVPEPGLPYCRKCNGGGACRSPTPNQAERTSDHRFVGKSNPHPRCVYAPLSLSLPLFVVPVTLPLSPHVTHRVPGRGCPPALKTETSASSPGATTRHRRKQPPAFCAKIDLPA